MGREQVYLIILVSMAVGHLYMSLPRMHIGSGSGSPCETTSGRDGTNTTSTNDTHAYPPFRAAAMMLVSKPWSESRGRNCWFNSSMDALQQYWYPTNPYPIILQHPDGWTHQEMKEIRATWPTLQFRFTKSHTGFNEVDIPAQPEDNNELSAVGYKKMCSYKTFGFLRDEAAADLDYVMHIDDDACLLEPVPYNVFETMHQRKVVYAFKQIFRDVPSVVKGLPEFADTFLRRRNLTYANPTLHEYLKSKGQVTWQGGIMSFSTNLEWIDLNEFRQKTPLVEFHSALEYSGMIFHRRWGDAPIRFLFAYMFWNRHQVLEVCSAYTHSTWRKAESTCPSPGSNSSLLIPIDDSVMNHVKRCGECWVAAP